VIRLFNVGSETILCPCWSFTTESDRFCAVVLVWNLNVQTAAELEKRKENFSKELDFVIADVVCSFLAVGSCCTFYCRLGS
jgi:hypothetical protein